MSAQKDAQTPYAASCNPPRRAKRPQASSLQDASSIPSASTDKSNQRRAPRTPILPKPADKETPPSPESDSASEEEDEYDPGRESAPAPKRRGRKPGTMSRSARESLRKLNHSKIEKARRTKINETLATLSTLVNERDRILASTATKGEVPKEDDAKGKKGKAKAEEKEFKLDVLVKTVEYMQDLIGRVKALEGTRCAQCGAADRPSSQENGNIQTLTASPKRKGTHDIPDVQRASRHKRPRHRLDEDDSYIGDDEHGLGNGAEEELPSPLPFVQKPATTSPPSISTSSPRLPPIASWLPHPYVDPSSLMPASSSGPTRSPTNMQLPSPPASGRFRPAVTLANMPALTLPGPAHPLTLPPSNGVQPVRHQRKSVSASPSVSPTWTPEDETAASLLLQMSSKPSSTSSSRSPPSLSGPLGIPPPREERERIMPRVLEVVTPGSLLGMRD
ncbi:hypothetical protein C8Q78DRAFT_1068810 [Trametes maxima]|nr:hypothetical protein C8Q78DRAFT_1068810 [Trametes maxima]